MPTQRIPDPYTTLGVRRGATPRQLRAAYRRLAKQYHPDLHADAQATEQMQRVNQAWEILSSPSRRAEYDAGASARAAASTGHWAGVPRRSPPVQPSAQSWTAAYGARPVHAGARPYARGAASAAYADGGSGGSPGPLAWAGLLVLVPVIALLAAVLTGGLLTFPLLGLLVVTFASRLFGRED